MTEVVVEDERPDPEPLGRRGHRRHRRDRRQVLDEVVRQDQDAVAHRLGPTGVGGQGRPVDRGGDGGQERNGARGAGYRAPGRAGGLRSVRVRRSGDEPKHLAGQPDDLRRGQDRVGEREPGEASVEVRSERLGALLRGASPRPRGVPAAGGPGARRRRPRRSPGGRASPSSARSSAGSRPIASQWRTSTSFLCLRASRPSGNQWVMSACFAAIFSVRCSPPPPTRIGGPPGWIGRGTFSACSIR